MDISAKSIGVNLGEKIILDNLSFNIKGGSLIGIIGPNGSGKTTLLKALAGLLKLERGSILLDNNIDIDKISALERARYISWLPQNNFIPFDFTAKDLVVYGRYPQHLGLPQKRDYEIAEQVIINMGAKDLLNRKISTLSTGEQKKIFISRVLSCNTKILFLDEPCANLDIAASVSLLDLLKKEADDGKIICLSIHDIMLTKQFCTHFIGLSMEDLRFSMDIIRRLDSQFINRIFRFSNNQYQFADFF